MTTTPPLTWGGLTAAQRSRLVAISRGEQCNGDAVWSELTLMQLIHGGWHWERVNGKLVEGNHDYLTPLGGELLRQRDAILVAALTAYANGEYLGKGKAQAALAQVQEGGEHE